MTSASQNLATTCLTLNNNNHFNTFIMKKLFMMIAMLVSSFTAMADDAITASLKVDSDKSGATVHVSLDNTTATYVAFQFDITFPEALGTLTNDNAVVTARLENGGTVDLTAAGGTASESTNFIIATNWLSGNKLRVLGYNLGNVAITQNSGEILTIKINATSIPANVTDWTAKFEGVDFVTENDLQETLLAVTNPDATATGEEEASWLMGDVNHSGVVDIDDVAAAINYSLGIPVPKFFVEQANINGDVDSEGQPKIDIDDVAAIINISLQ